MIKQPPSNPFKPEEEEQEVCRELPPLPDKVEAPVFNVKLEEPENVSGNGHSPEAVTSEQEEEARVKKEEEEELERMREEQDNAKIPGSGYLFNVKEKHLPEATRLNEREIFTFGVGNVQDAVLNLNRTKSIFEVFRDSIFRLKISAGGKGREENIAVRQVDAEEKANAARGSLNGI